MNSACLPKGWRTSLILECKITDKKTQLGCIV
jgi:hypothetical protein